MHEISIIDANHILVAVLAILAGLSMAWVGWRLAEALRKLVVILVQAVFAVVLGGLGVGLVMKLAPYIEEVNR